MLASAQVRTGEVAPVFAGAINKLQCDCGARGPCAALILSSLFPRPLCPWGRPGDWSDTLIVQQGLEPRQQCPFVVVTQGNLALVALDHDAGVHAGAGFGQRNGRILLLLLLRMPVRAWGTGASRSKVL